MFNTPPNLNTSHPLTSPSPAGLRRLPLWYQYPLCARAPYGFVFYYGVKVFNLAVGAPCNFLVVWQIARKKSDTSTSDIFIFNLAVLDAYFCLMTPVEMVNHLLLDDPGIWYFQRLAYGVKDLAVLFLVSSQKEFTSFPPTWKVPVTLGSYRNNSKATRRGSITSRLLSRKSVSPREAKLNLLHLQILKISLKEGSAFNRFLRRNLKMNPNIRF